MENKLGRKSMQDWQEMTDALTARVYKSGFNAGYDAAKDETPDVETMANLLVERYTDGGLSDLMMAIDKLCPHVPNKSANQQRAELIQRAREFVEEQKTTFGGLTERYGYDAPSDPWSVTDAEFIVNKEKNAVVCLLRKQMRKDVVDKGIAKCMPDEVFNEWIGRAIALARALEIDVPQEFIHAVQPDEVVIGHIIESSIISDLIAEVLEWRPNRDHAYPNGKAFGHTHDSGFLHTSRVTIIDDTNAQYGR